MACLGILGVKKSAIRKGKKYFSLENRADMVREQKLLVWDDLFSVFVFFCCDSMARN